MLPPLVQRELRVALFRRGAHREWVTTAWVTGVISLVVVMSLFYGQFVSRGGPLFLWLFCLATFGVVRRGFSLTADLFSEERRNGTLGLVVLTGLSPLEIFIYKLLGALLLVAYGLLGGLPFFAIPFVAGGVLPSQFIQAFVFLANALLFCVAIGLLASVMHRDGGQAYLAAIALAVVLCLATPCAYWIGAVTVGANRLNHDWLALSPAYPAYLVFASFGGRPIKDFWLSSGVTLGYSVVALLLAAIILQRTWRINEAVLAEAGWSQRWRRWLRNGGAWRQRLQKKLLEEQAFCWLATRNRAPVLAAYFILALAGVVWIAGWHIVGPRWFTFLNALVSSIVLHQALLLVSAYAAGQRLAEERLSGGFELLLTSPLRVEEIIKGQSKALLLQFRVVVLLTAIFDAGFCWVGVAALSRFGLARVAFVVAWVLMMVFWFAAHMEAFCRAMWISLWTGRPAYAAMKAGGRVWWMLLWIIFFAQLFTRNFREGGVVLLFICGFVVFPIVATFGTMHVLRNKLANEFKQIACAPIPSRSDKRFKHWSPEKIYPPGRWGELILRPGRLRHSRRRRSGRMDALNG
jgi:hypothetical protein